MANHPLIKDVEKWILDSFSFMDGIGYDVVFDDEEIKNTNIIVADIDGLTDSDFEKGKKNLLKSIPNKIKAEFPYLRIRSSKDGDYFIMYIVFADNDDYFKTKNIPYINLNESKKSTRKSIKESVEFDKEKDIYIAQIKDSSISFAYTPIDTDGDFNGYFVFDGDDVIEYLNWKGADANDMLKAFDDFEKAVKKYTSKEDAKIIIKDFHDKLGI